MPGKLSFRDAVYFHLRSQGKTFQEMADTIGVSKQRVSEVFNGNWITIPATLLSEIANHLGMPEHKVIREAIKVRLEWLESQKLQARAMATRARQERRKELARERGE